MPFSPGYPEIHNVNTDLISLDPLQVQPGPVVLIEAIAFEEELVPVLVPVLDLEVVVVVVVEVVPVLAVAAALVVLAAVVVLLLFALLYFVVVVVYLFTVCCCHLVDTLTASVSPHLPTNTVLHSWHNK